MIYDYLVQTESSEEVITTSTITSTTTKSSAKIKKKKIEGVIGNSDVTSQSPPQSSINTSRTKKVKKSKKKSDLEKENISVVSTDNWLYLNICRLHDRFFIFNFFCFIFF